MPKYRDEDPYLRDPGLWRRIRATCKLRVLLVLLCGILVGLAVPAILDNFLWNKDKDIRPECQLPPAFRLNALSRYGPGADSWSTEKWSEQCSKEKSCSSAFVGDGIPHCYHPHPANFYYSVTEKNPCSESHGSGFDFYARLERPNKVSEKKIVRTLRLRIDEMEDHRVLIKVFNGDSATDFAPYDYLNYKTRNSQNETRCHRPGRLYDISPEPEVNGRAFVAVRRKGGRSVFNTNFGAQIIEEQYLEITTVLPSPNIYGLGQGRHTTLRHDLKRAMNWSLFAGQDEQWGHGVHPFYLCIEEDGKAHGVLLEHSNALEVTMKRVPSVTYKTTGSSLAFHVLMGPTPKDVIRQLTDLVGRPEMPPYWALGHHVCRNGKAKLKDGTHPSTSVNDLKNKTVPQESDCFNDILSLRPLNESWNDITEFYELLSKNTQKLLLVHVPHVPKDEAQDDNTNYVFLEGKSEKVSGKLSGIDVVFPNYFKNLVNWNQNRIKRFMDNANVTFDGYLLSNNTPVDEREPSRVCSNQSSLNFPTFVPGKLNLWNKTLCLDCCHGRSLNAPCKRLRDMNHYNLHNLYGYQHTKTVSEAINNLDEYKTKKPFLASLSTFTGSGKYGAQFSVGMNSTWEDMKVSLVNSLEFNLYGIPLVGSPVCGYHFKNDRDLCSRWAQLAAFQPLLLSYHRYHDDKSFPTPLLMDEFVASIAAASIQLRYSLLPYLYTQFYYASVNGTPVMRPLFLEFPDDPKTWEIDEQFLWGPGVMFSPVMTNATTKYPAYFPKGTWYDFYLGDIEYHGTRGSYKNITAIEYHINIHLRGGYIVATQRQALYTEEGRNSSYKIRIALEPATEERNYAFAQGQIYIDDGLHKNSPSCIVNMLVENNNLTIVPTFIRGTAKDLEKLDYNYYVDGIYILGLKSYSADYYCQLNGEQEKCRPDEEHGTLTLRQLGNKVNLLKSNSLIWRDPLEF